MKTVKNRAIDFFINQLGLESFSCRKCSSGATGSTQIASVIRDLRAAGWDIETAPEGICEFCGRDDAFLDAFFSKEPIYARKKKAPSIKSPHPDIKELIDRSINAAILSIEFYNRPVDLGRPEAVLMFIQQSFELLLKAAILKSNQSIHTEDGQHTISFERCLQICHEQCSILSKDARALLAALCKLRNAAAHYYIAISEEHLYIQAQAGLSLYNQLLRSAFGLDLADRLPSRVLPISTTPPRNIDIFFDSELSQIDKLIQQRKLQRRMIAAHLRSLTAYVSPMDNNEEYSSEKALDRIVDRRRAGESWQMILPELFQVNFSASESGLSLQFVLKEKGDIPVRFAHPGEEVEGYIISKNIDIRNKYNLRFNQIAAKLDLNAPQLTALLKEYNIKGNQDYHYLLEEGSTKIDKYSKKTLDLMRQQLEKGIDLKALVAKWRKK